MLALTRSKSQVRDQLGRRRDTGRGTLKGSGQAQASRIQRIDEPEQSLDRPDGLSN